PAISSLVSAKGPSMTVRLVPENLTRAPLELGWSPSPASITPAFTSSSLYFPIAVRSSVLGITPASLSLLALTITMNLIVGSPCGFRFGELGSPGHFGRLQPCLYLDDERGTAKSTRWEKKPLITPALFSHRPPPDREKRDNSQE